MLIHERKLCDVLPKDISNLYPLDHKYISIFLNYRIFSICRGVGTGEASEAWAASEIRG